MIEYPCPECGSDGPHQTREEPPHLDELCEMTRGRLMADCDWCRVEFEIPKEVILEP